MVSINFISYFFALFSICSLWLFDHKKFAGICFALAIVTAFSVDILALEGLLITGVYVAANFVYFTRRTNNIIKILLWFLIFGTAFSLGSNWLDGFHSWKIIAAEVISDQGKPYDLILHFDAIIACMGVLLFTFSPARQTIHYKHILKKIAPFSITVMSVLMFFVITFKVVKLDPKVPDFWIVWLMSNLLITCVVEETIFRLLMQNTLSNILISYKFRAPFAIIVPSLFYAMYYMPVPLASYITLMLMSCCYGYAYYLTRRLEAAIILHLVMNAMHFFLFTYPQLQVG